jgi:ABC-2 type transport system permease protein
VRSEKWNGVLIQVMYHPEHGANIDRMIAGARATLDYFSKTFGPYPYKELRLVEHVGDSKSLHASPINIAYEEGFSGMNSAADKRNIDFVFAVVAHEASHQWWGNQLSPADVEGGPVLSESLAWYSSMVLVARTLGEDHLQRMLDMMHEGDWTISTRASVPLMRVYNRYTAYRKGPFAMVALREYVGEPEITTALQRLFDKYKSAEPPQPTTRDLFRELKAVTPDSLQGLLSDLFERNTWWELKTKGVAAVPLAGGKWRVDLDLEARKVVVDTKGAETAVPLDDPVEIGVYGAGGSATRGLELYRSMHRIRAGVQRVTVVVDKKPVRAGIDPRYLLIDDEPADNLKDIK